MQFTELLAPAGTLHNLRYALAYGADAVYAGMPRYSLRVRNNDFHRPETLACGNKFAIGDELELILPGGNRSFRLERMFDRDGEGMREAPGGGHHVRIPLDVPGSAMGLLARSL
jgi:Peptidase family U32 C-terminal domain